MKISIAMATYNGAKYLREQLDSILHQTFSDWELVVGDDCSTDLTMEILTEYSQKDSRISIFQNETNLGFKNNFESIFSRCNGEYVACCDQDDVWTNDHLEILLKNIGNNDCIGANALICNSQLDASTITTLEFNKIRNNEFKGDILFKHECYYNLIQGTASLFKKDLFKKATKIPDKVKHHDHWIALNAAICSGCCYIPAIILRYRNHESNAIGTKSSSIPGIFKTILEVRSLRNEIYQSRIALLKEISQKNNTPLKQQTINDALIFFTNLQKNTRRISAVVFFIKNYQSITLSSIKQCGTFLYRIVALAFFGILL